MGLGGLRTAFQNLAEQYMETPVIIKSRLAPAKDPGDRTGDNTILWEVTPTTVMGWFVDAGAQSFQSDGSMRTVTDRPLVRLPMDTVIGIGDKVTIGGKEYTVADVTEDETWSVWLKAMLTRIE